MEYNLPMTVSSLLMTGKYWKETIFVKASTSVSQLNVDALFLSLAALEILEVQKTTDGIQWIVGQQPPVLPHQSNVNVTFINATIAKANYKLDEYWNGIHQHPPMRICVRLGHRRFL
jgi:hypothetical protein